MPTRSRDLPIALGKGQQQTWEGKATQEEAGDGGSRDMFGDKTATTLGVSLRDRTQDQPGNPWMFLGAQTELRSELGVNFFPPLPHPRKAPREDRTGRILRPPLHLTLPNLSLCPLTVVTPRQVGSGQRAQANLGSFYKESPGWASPQGVVRALCQACPRCLCGEGASVPRGARRTLRQLWGC